MKFKIGDTVIVARDIEGIYREDVVIVFTITRIGINFKDTYSGHSNYFYSGSDLEIAPPVIKELFL